MKKQDRSDRPTKEKSSFVTAVQLGQVVTALEVTAFIRVLQYRIDSFSYLKLVRYILCMEICTLKIG